MRRRDAECGADAIADAVVAATNIASRFRRRLRVGLMPRGGLMAAALYIMPRAPHHATLHARRKLPLTILMMIPIDSVFHAAAY